MDNNSFEDRILICSDCHGEFVFTAGEQLFFFDKQFKNDPKRCKPCKSRRAGLTSAATGNGPAAAGLSRTETRTQCSECGIQTTVPFKPTQGRPVLCRSCFQAKNRAAKPAEFAAASIPEPEPLSARETVSALDALAPALDSDAATQAAASMAAAPAGSSVASSADLATVAAIEALVEPESVVLPVQIPTQLLAAEDATHSAGAELEMAQVKSPDA